jgi:hypothetical protein
MCEVCAPTREGAGQLLDAVELDLHCAEPDLGAGLGVHERELVPTQEVAVREVVRRAGLGLGDVVRHDRVEHLVALAQIGARQVEDAVVVALADPLDRAFEHPEDVPAQLEAALHASLVRFAADGFDHFGFGRPSDCLRIGGRRVDDEVSLHGCRRHAPTSLFMCSSIPFEHW